MSRRTRLTQALSVVVLLLSPPAWADDENSVTRWMGHALQTVRDRNIGTPNSGRLYAMVGAAIYDAVNGIDTVEGDTREHALVPATGAPDGASRDAAVVAAAHAVLRSFVPVTSDYGAFLDGLRDAEIEALGAADPSVIAGRDWGAYVGQQVVALRSNDGTQSALNMPAGTGIGEHRAAFDARFRNMVPFAIASKNRYLSEPPPALTGFEYAEAFDDVKRFGAQDGDPERNAISEFWIAEANTTREPGTWPQALLAIVQQQGTVDSLSDSARLFALVTMAIGDAVAVVWDIKATYFTWRPTVAIREGDADGNPLTLGDPAWTSRSGAVGGSPEYNSGTSAFAGAAAAVLERFYCSERVAFCFETDNAPSGPRCYSSAMEAAREAGRSRVYQGIHFQFSNADGRRVGRLIGSEVFTTKLRRPGESQGCELP